MFKHILVTLDGSDLSERALSTAFQLAQKFESQVTLLRVINTDTAVATAAGAGPSSLRLLDMREATEQQESTEYLQAIAAQWRGTGVPVAIQVAYGAPPEMIVQVSDQTNADLIVMSTHGRSGLNRFLYGSVAEAVLRGTQLPLLLIPVK